SVALQHRGGTSLCAPSPARAQPPLNQNGPVVVPLPSAPPRQSSLQALCFHKLTNPSPATPLFSHPCKSPGGVGTPRSSCLRLEPPAFARSRHATIPQFGHSPTVLVSPQ